MKALAHKLLGGVKFERFAMLFLVNFVAGTLAPIVIGALSREPVAVLDQILLGVAIFSALTLIEMLLRLEQLHELRVVEYNVWRDRTDLDKLLSEIRSDLRDVVTDDTMRDKFFLDHYKRELGGLRDSVRETISGRVIHIERNHIDSTHVLLSLFDAPNHNFFRATADCREIGSQFDVTFEVYFREWTRRLEAGSVESLRRLFIWSDPSELKKPNVRKLLAFHNSGLKGLEARVIAAKEFGRFKADYGLYDGSLDVGIFSDQYVYVGRTRDADDITGTFSREPATIRRYTEVFDAAWTSASSVSGSTIEGAKLTQSQLFDLSYHLPEPKGGTNA